MVLEPEPGGPSEVRVGGEAAKLVGEQAVAIEGRSLRQIAWSRLKRDRVALAGAVVVILLILHGGLAPLIVKLVGDLPTEFHQERSTRRRWSPSEPLAG
jgi:hypothetical protein